MNIFYLHPDTKTCAMMHNDKHTIKMIVEYAQLLSTAHRVLDGTESIVLSDSGRRVKAWRVPDLRDEYLYKATHINHPSAIWTRQSKANYQWLASLLPELCKEYTHRYGKIHKVERDDLAELLYRIPPKNIPTGPFTEPRPAMPDEVKIVGSSIASYRNYYIKNKASFSTWTGKINSRPIPDWFKNINISMETIDA